MSITQLDPVGIFLGENVFETFTLPDAQIPAAGLSAGYVVGLDPDVTGTYQETEEVSNTIDAVAILAHDVADGADATVRLCIAGRVRSDALSFPAGQTLTGNRSATVDPHKETLRKAGIICIDRSAQLSPYDVGTPT